MSPVVPAPTHRLVGSLDIGTSSTRFYIFSCDTGEVITYHQLDIPLSYPQPGWVEQSGNDLLERSVECIEQACRKLSQLGYAIESIVTVGITNQRETVVAWSKSTGRPYGPAIVWSDNRTADIVAEVKSNLGSSDEMVRHKTGLSLSTYFSGPKLLWLYRNNAEYKKAIDAKDEDCLVGTVDAWLVWNLAGVHVTDVSNASRTLLMNITSMAYDDVLLRLFNVPVSILPKICSSSEIYGRFKSGPLAGKPISGILGDQQSALVGHFCYSPGQAKTTYGTGCFLLCNIGTKPIFSDEGLLTTVAYQLGPKSPVTYAFEGAVAVAGAGVNWLRDSLKIAPSAQEIEKLASSVGDTGGCTFVPAFSGLYCPHWEPRAEGIITGLTYSISDAHLARAALEAVCQHVAEITDIVAGVEELPLAAKGCLATMRVDGGMSTSDFIMQMQADLTGIDIIRPSMLEVTAFGAAIAAGLAENINIFRIEDGSIKGISVGNCRKFEPKMTKPESKQRKKRWHAAIRRCLLDLEETSESAPPPPMNSAIKYFPLQFFVFSSLSLFVLSKMIQLK